MSLERGRQLRANQTPAERRFWQITYIFRKAGFHFRRQAQIGPFYADFVCHHAALVVEIDGDTHGTEHASARDERRTRYIESRGYRVLRFTNAEVLSNADGVFATLRDVLGDGPPPLIPPRKGEGVD